MLSASSRKIEKISFKILGKNFIAPLLERQTKKGLSMWAFISEAGNEGDQIEPLDVELPQTTFIEETEFSFQIVSVNKQGQRVQKPFNKTRVVETEIKIQNVPISIYCRVTKKRNGKWHLIFKGIELSPPSSELSSPRAARKKQTKLPESEIEFFEVSDE